MEDGRELDVLIAERVIGLRLSKECEDEDNGTWDWYIMDDAGNFSWSRPLPPYSSDIASAWDVVDKLIKNNIQLELSNDPAGRWCAKLIGMEVGSQRVGFAIESSAPHAICLAALKAVGAL